MGYEELRAPAARAVVAVQRLGPPAASVGAPVEPVFVADARALEAHVHQARIRWTLRDHVDDFADERLTYHKWLPRDAAIAAFEERLGITGGKQRVLVDRKRTRLNSSQL